MKVFPEIPSVLIHFHLISQITMHGHSYLRAREVSFPFFHLSSRGSQGEGGWHGHIERAILLI